MAEITRTMKPPEGVVLNDNGTVQESTVRLLDAHARALKAGDAAFLEALDCESGVETMWVFVDGYIRKIQEDYASQVEA